MASSTNCILPHRRVPDEGEEFTDSNGRTGVGDGSKAIWDYVKDGGKPVGGSHEGSLLCVGHLTKLTELIAFTPTMVSWLRSNITPSGSQKESDGGSKKPKGPSTPLPLSDAAVDAADAELACLASWTRMVAEERGEHGPDLSSAWWNAGDDRVAGIRAGNTTVVDEVTRYLLRRIDWIAEQDWIEEFLDEVARPRQTHLARWPHAIKPRPLKGYLCRECDRDTMVVFPPSNGPIYNTAGDFVHAWPVAVTCTDLRCGWKVPESEWPMFERLWQQLETERKGKRTA